MKYLFYICSLITNKNNIMYQPWLEYSRKPTEAEIRFGHGARHYKLFKYNECFKPNGDLKKRVKCPIDGLIYTR